MRTAEIHNHTTVNALLAAGIPENILKLVALQVRVETLVQWLAPPQAELFEETYEEHLAVALTGLAHPSAAKAGPQRSGS